MHSLLELFVAKGKSSSLFDRLVSSPCCLLVSCMKKMSSSILSTMQSTIHTIEDKNVAVIKRKSMTI